MSAQELVVRPCFWMRGMLNRLAEGRSCGVFTWYAKAHAKVCPNCCATYRALLALREGLRQIGLKDEATALLSADRWEQIERDCR